MHLFENKLSVLKKAKLIYRVYREMKLRLLSDTENISVKSAILSSSPKYREVTQITHVMLNSNDNSLQGNALLS